MAKCRANDHSKYANWIDPLEVIPYERNAKIHTERQISNICNSIRRFGWQQDTVITKDNVLVIGHGRRLAAIELGCEMPYHVIDKNADDLTEKDIRELRIADNQTNAETGLDFSILDEEIDDLDFEGFDFDFGFAEPAGEYEPEQEKKNSMRDKYLVPPFSVIYGNKTEWLARKRAWVKFGIRSEIGRGGDLCFAFTNGWRDNHPLKETQSNANAHGQSIGLCAGLLLSKNKSREKGEAKDYADGLIEKREQIRKGTYRGNSL